MDTVLIWIILGILALMWLANYALKESQRNKGQARCHYCGARLKFTGFGSAHKGSGVAGYASVCRKCGREQPSASMST